MLECDEASTKEVSDNTNAGFLFPSLPHSILLIVLQHLDAVSICRLEQTCRWCRALLKQPSEFDTAEDCAPQVRAQAADDGDHGALSLSRTIWKPLFYQRFKMHSLSARQKQNSQPHRFKELFIRRHRIEESACRGLVRLDHETDQTRLLFVTTHFVSMGQNVMDLCWRIWAQPLGEGYYYFPSIQGEITNTLEVRRLYAQSFLRMLHCASGTEDIMLCLRRRQQQKLRKQQSIESDIAPLDVTLDEQDPLDLEELMILVSKFFYELSPETIEDTTSPLIVQELDEIAAQVRSRLSKSGNRDDTCPRNIVEAMHHVFFDDNQKSFTGNTQDYYNYRNSLLHTTIESRTGLPLTLAIIYKCVARRLRLSADIVGLPGHIVVHLPDLGSYVDVFSRGLLLSRQDCSDIVERSYGIVMNSAFMQPLTPELVLQRVLNNLENAFNQPNSDTTQRHRVMVTVLRAILRRPDPLQLEDCRHLMSLAWVSEHVSNRGAAWRAW